MYLLNKGADPTIQNAKGETVMTLLATYSLDLLEGKEGFFFVTSLDFKKCILSGACNSAAF